MGKGPRQSCSLEGHIMGVTEPDLLMATKLGRIATLSRDDIHLEFKWLMPHFSLDNLASCFNELDGKKAVGSD